MLTRPVIYNPLGWYINVCYSQGSAIYGQVWCDFDMRTIKFILCNTFLRYLEEIYGVRTVINNECTEKDSQMYFVIYI